MPILRIRIVDRVFGADYEERVKLHNASVGNSGFDLILTKSMTVCHVAKLAPTGICAEMIEDDGSSGGYFLVPRSSIYKHLVCQHNSVGIIDPGYRGEIKVPIRSTRPTGWTSIHEGTRLFQLVHPSLKPFQVEIVEVLSETVRGTKRFGSSGQEGGTTKETPQKTSQKIKEAGIEYDLEADRQMWLGRVKTDTHTTSPTLLAQVKQGLVDRDMDPETVTYAMVSTILAELQKKKPDPTQ
jgi:dUTP pyrophosphatase